MHFIPNDLANNRSEAGDSEYPNMMCYRENSAERSKILHIVLLL